MEEAVEEGVMNLSVVVITLNEERNIGDCLRSVAWADEIIVVDSFSTDETVAIAREFTPRVVRNKWPGMVGPQRNVGLDLARSKWVLFLDADERVTDPLREEIGRVIRKTGSDSLAGGKIPRKNYFFGKWIRASYPDYTSRFLRRGAGRYNEIPGRGFDTLEFSGPGVCLFENPLIHLTGETLAQRVGKLDFDSALQADEKFRAGKKIGGVGLFFHPAIAFLRVYFLKRGFLDGIRGFIYACLVSFNTFMKYAKLWEKRLSGYGER
jgi:glycosyltransferase involved in cell wall biosynthesis